MMEKFRPSICSRLTGRDVENRGEVGSLNCTADAELNRCSRNIGVVWPSNRSWAHGTLLSRPTPPNQPQTRLSSVTTQHVQQLSMFKSRLIL